MREREKIKVYVPTQKKVQKKEGKGLIHGLLNFQNKSKLTQLEKSEYYIQDGEEGNKKLLNFIHTNPLEIEIGFGKGLFLIERAKALQSHKLIGIETRFKWCVYLLQKCEMNKIENLRICFGDAREVIKTLVPDERVNSFFILFPDPWWKHKQHKRRLTDDDFIMMLQHKLVPNGNVFIKTDIKELFIELREKFLSISAFKEETKDILDNLPLTNREVRLKKEGIPVFFTNIIKKE